MSVEPAQRIKVTLTDAPKGGREVVVFRQTGGASATVDVLFTVTLASVRVANGRIDGTH